MCRLPALPSWLRDIYGWQAGTSLWRGLEVSCLWCRKHRPMELSVSSYAQASLCLPPFLAKLIGVKVPIREVYKATHAFVAHVHTYGKQRCIVTGISVLKYLVSQRDWAKLHSYGMTQSTFCDP